eukprot:3763768-Pleurochrysis_carterae.AAC.4
MAATSCHARQQLAPLPPFLAHEGYAHTPEDRRCQLQLLERSRRSRVHRRSRASVNHLVLLS